MKEIDWLKVTASDFYSYFVDKCKEKALDNIVVLLHRGI